MAWLVVFLLFFSLKNVDPYDHYVDEKQMITRGKKSFLKKKHEKKSSSQPF